MKWQLSLDPCACPDDASQAERAGGAAVFKASRAVNSAISAEAFCDGNGYVGSPKVSLSAAISRAADRRWYCVEISPLGTSLVGRGIAARVPEHVRVGFEPVASLRSLRARPCGQTLPW